MMNNNNPNNLKQVDKSNLKVKSKAHKINKKTKIKNHNKYKRNNQSKK